MSKDFYFKQFNLAQMRRSNVKTVLFQTTQFSISTQFSTIWLIGRTLSSAMTPDQSDGNEGVHRIPQRFSIIWTSPSDFLVSYTGHSLRALLSAEMQSVFSIAQADWFGFFIFNGISIFVGYLMPKPFSRRTVVVIFNPHLGGGIKGFYSFPKGIHPKREHNNATGVRTRFLRLRNPSL